LITIETQLCYPELFRVDYMGRHKPIPGGSAAAVQAADAHGINTKQHLLKRVGWGLVVIRLFYILPIQKGQSSAILHKYRIWLSSCSW